MTLLTQRPHMQSLTLSMRDRLALFSATVLPSSDSAFLRHDNVLVR